MKKYYLIIPVILALIIAVPMVSRAEEGSEDSETSTTNTINRPKPIQMLRNEIEQKRENVKANQELKKEEVTERLLEKKGARVELRKASSSEVRAEVKETRIAGREDIKNASSSVDRKEIRREMKQDVFKIKLNSVLRQLNLSITNVKQIRDRISARIQQAETNGKNMTEAKSALAIADTKIAAAETDIASLASFVPATPTTNIASSTASSTPGINLDRPRQLGDTAIKAVKNAKDSLVEVVKAIAKNLGVKLGQTATTTTSTTTTQ